MTTAPVTLGRPAVVRPATWAARSARLPAPLLVAPLLVLGGAALLVWTYALLPEAPLRHLLYWLALGLAFAGCALLGAVAAPRAGRQLVALAVFGAVTWLPYFLRSPDRLLFVDERYHLDILQRIAATGGTDLQARLFPLPGTFPGLEGGAITLMAWTGLGAVDAVRVLTLTLHVLVPMLAYLAVRAIGLRRSGAFLAALVYAANTSYFFFHSVFSYESLGIVLFLTAWVLVAHLREVRRRLPPGRLRFPRPTANARGDGAGTDARESLARRWRRDERALLLTALPVLAAVAVTHHVSSYLLAGMLVGGWVLARVMRSPAAGVLGRLALAAVVLDVAWFVVSADAVVPYLVDSIAARVQGIVDTLLLERSQPRQLFANSDQPTLERMLAFTYPPLVLLLGLGGLVLAWRQGWRSPLLFLLALVGPLAWALTTPAVVTRSGELAYRAWPFLFLGVALFAALALRGLDRRLRRRWGPRAAIVPFVLVSVLLFGGFSIGENQSGRFPTADPVTAAGSGNVTDDQVAAARWLRATVGEGHVVVADSGTSVTFATDGGQQILGWESWYPFVVRDPTRILPFLEETGTEYVVVDRQIAELPPRYNGYFRAPEIPPELDPGVPFPAALLDRFDTLPGLQKIYDGGRIRIYAVVEPGRGPLAGTARQAGASPTPPSVSRP